MRLTITVTIKVNAVEKLADKARDKGGETGTSLWQPGSKALDSPCALLALLVAKKP